LRCPICRHETQVAPDDLQTNHALVQLLEARDEAVRSDARNKIFGAGASSPHVDAPPCPQHGQPVLAYCLKDERPVCVACVATDPCRKHPIEAVSSYLAVRRKAWTEAEAELTRQDRELLQVANQIAETKKSVCAAAINAEERVKVCVAQIIEAINKRGDELKKQIALTRDRQCADLTGDALLLEQVRSRIALHCSELKPLVTASDQQGLQQMLAGSAADPAVRAQETLAAARSVDTGLVGKLEGPAVVDDLDRMLQEMRKFGSVKEPSCVQNITVRTGDVRELVITFDHTPEADEYYVSVDPNPRAVAALVPDAAAPAAAAVRMTRPGVRTQLARLHTTRPVAAAAAAAPPQPLLPVIHQTLVAIEGERQVCHVLNVPAGCTVTVRVRPKFVGNRVGPWSPPLLFSTPRLVVCLCVCVCVCVFVCVCVCVALISTL
jgi:hypothetical protein